MTTPNQRKSLKQENAGAKAFGGERNVMSGGGWVRKNDVRTPDFSIEYKVTEKKSYSLKSKELAQAERYALIDGRIMLFGVRMDDGRNWIVISEDDFLEIVGAESL